MGHEKINYRANKPPEYETITEDVILINDPDESKAHIANYYEQLYKAREALPEQEEESQRISEMVKNWSEDQDHNTNQMPITTEEVKKGIKN